MTKDNGKYKHINCLKNESTKVSAQRCSAKKDVLNPLALKGLEISQNSFEFLFKKTCIINRVRITNSTSARKYFLSKGWFPWLTDYEQFRTFMP